MPLAQTFARQQPPLAGKAREHSAIRSVRASATPIGGFCWSNQKAWTSRLALRFQDQKPLRRLAASKSSSAPVHRVNLAWKCKPPCPIAATASLTSTPPQRSLLHSASKRPLCLPFSVQSRRANYRRRAAATAQLATRDGSSPGPTQHRRDESLNYLSAGQSDLVDCCAGQQYSFSPLSHHPALPQTGAQTVS